MASIMKRGNTYSVRYNYKDHAGKPCKGWETFKTKAEAQERKITVEKELLDGTFLVPNTMTVEEMLYKWIPIQSSKHKWSPKTYTQSVAMVQNLIVPYIGKRKVQDLRTYDIEQFYATLSQTPCGQYVHGVKQELTENQKKRLLSSTSIHEVHTLLKTAFSYAVDWDLIHKSPTPREAPKINTEERTIWDERTMLAALQTIENPILHLAVHLTLVGALREGEVAGLTPEDIDFDAANGMGTFTVNRSMQRVQKDTLAQVDKGCILRIFPDKLEGSKTSLILKDTKTEASCRTIFMTAALREELKQWLERLKREEALDPERYRNSGMLLRLPNGLAVEPVLIRKKFLKWQDAHPEFPRIVFHGLRHSSATYQLMISGGDIKAVQGTTGHASADMLVNTYAHIQQSSRVELGKKFENGFYAKPDTPSPQAVPAAGEPTISMTALLELLKDADPEMKAKLRLALLT
ncbi:site-specific integrase [Faecalibacterium duncaniae]|uniref:site-specific integrase n=1 Tax=Faecalibacterium duncaniae (strain DSM 17677 / JCM 31915 / A2-165) TaxID=411483 RepID=UPI00294195F0|nr:tyrosine-type recombinase/integrase [Faecalibacterium duncaniae]MDV5049407.1 tyrosine-type recombinase/integrase [Faecalibacterium duncaniae]